MSLSISALNQSIAKAKGWRPIRVAAGFQSRGGWESPTGERRYRVPNYAGEPLELLIEMSARQAVSLGPLPDPARLHWRRVGVGQQAWDGPTFGIAVARAWCWLNIENFQDDAPIRVLSDA